MGLPRVRFTVRWLMAAVAVVALVMGAELTRRRWAHRQQMARHYARAERTYRDQAKEIAAEIDRGRSDLDLALERRLWMADHAAQFRRKWEERQRAPTVGVRTIRASATVRSASTG